MYQQWGGQGPGLRVCGKEEVLWLGDTLRGKSKPPHWLFSSLPHQIFQAIGAAEWLDEAGYDVIVVSSLLQCLHADVLYPSLSAC